MKFSARYALLLAFALTGCAAPGPKTVLLDSSIQPSAAAIVEPTAVPGGLMLIKRVDGKSTYTASIGYFGSLYLPPGKHEFVVDVSHGFSIQDAGGPAWTLPAGVQAAPLESRNSFRNVFFVKTGWSRPVATFEAGKTYEIKFGFDRTDPEKPIPVTWVAEVPGTYPGPAKAGAEPAE